MQYGLDAFVFDMDGLMLDTEPLYKVAWQTVSGLTDRFKVIVTGDEVARGKPAPDIYLEAARRLDVAPGACVALEDSEAGVLAASRAGMRALMVPDGASPSDAAVHAAFRVVGSLNEAHDLIARLVSSTHSA